MIYDSHPERLTQEGKPKWWYNSGWRRNFKNWDNLFKAPQRGLLRLRSAIQELKLPVTWKVIEFDPDWHGRWDTCVDGSPIMFYASVQFPNGSNGYIDLHSKQAGGNGALYKAKEQYCNARGIPYLAMVVTLRSDEMKYLIQEWIRRNK